MDAGWLAVAVPAGLSGVMVGLGVDVIDPESKRPSTIWLKATTRGPFAPMPVPVKSPVYCGSRVELSLR